MKVLESKVFINVPGKPVEDFIHVTQLSEADVIDSRLIPNFIKKDITKWADLTVGASYQLNKKADLYYKVSSQALLPSLRFIGELIVDNSGTSPDLDPKTMKKFAEFEKTSKR